MIISIPRIHASSYSAVHQHSAVSAVLHYGTWPCTNCAKVLDAFDRSCVLCVLASHRTAKAVGHQSWVQPRAASPPGTQRRVNGSHILLPTVYSCCRTLAISNSRSTQGV